MDHVVGLGPVMWQMASRLRAPGRGRHFSWARGAKKVHKCIYKHYICVLLIKTN